MKAAKPIISIDMKELRQALIDPHTCLYKQGQPLNFSYSNKALPWALPLSLGLWVAQSDIKV